MGASALMSVGVRAMAANYLAMQTTGHNIANASVEGYSRQRVELSTSLGQFTGAGFFGKGVEVTTVARDYNQFLAREAVHTGSLAAYDSAREDQLAQLEPIFLGGEEGLGFATGEFLNSFVDVASRPQDLAARQVVLSNADALANRFASAASQIDSSQQGVKQALANSTVQINGLTAKIADVNQRIAALKGSDHEPNDLLDLRGQLLADLGSYLQVSTVLNTGDNTLGVFIAGGQRLVLGSKSVDLQVGTDEFDSSRAVLEVVESDGPHTIDTSALGSGSVAGLLRFQDDDLVRARSLIGQLANSLASAVNDQQALGVDMTDSVGADLFALGHTAVVLPAKANTVGPVPVSVDVDPTAAKASEYELFNQGGNWQLQERPSGALHTLVPNGVGGFNPVDGLTISIGGGAAATDRFLLQPVARAANGMSALLTDPRSLAAATAGSENANAQALVALRDELRVGRIQDPATSALSGGSTFTDAWASAMADVGVRIQGAKTATEISGSMAASAKASLEAVSGVNLDEEAANLMQFQQGYQAAAKVLQAAQAVFDILLSVAGR